MSSDVSSELTERTARGPAADLYLTDDAAVVDLEIPGFAADELSVALAGRAITISGRRPVRRGVRRYLLHERCADEFRREFLLPPGSDCRHLAIQLDDGVLTVRAPRIPWTRTPPVQLSPTFAVNPDCAAD